MTSNSSDTLLDLLSGDKDYPKWEDLKSLISGMDNHRVLAKVFILDGTPFVFEKNPMKYIVFKEQVANQFDIGSQDVCIVGSARLGYSPSPYKFGTPFKETSDVDVVIISDPLFDAGSQELFSYLSRLGPQVHEIRDIVEGRAENPGDKSVPSVRLEDWKVVKESIRNLVFQNFNPGLLPRENHLRVDIFEKISSTTGLFLALEPKVFVSKIRCRIFRTWKAAEDYYTNSLREAKKFFSGSHDIEEEAASEDLGGEPTILSGPQGK